MQKKALIIINQHTAKPKLRIDLLEILDIFTRGGLACLTRPTQKAGDAERYTAANAEAFDIVICMGGDGTLNEVIAGLCELPPEKRPPVGYIPAGTTNDFAASIGLPSDPLDAAKFIMNAEPRWMDCGRIDGHIFNYIASIGAFTEVSYDTPQPLKNLLGHFAYLLEGVKHLSDIKPYSLSFTAEDADGTECAYSGDFVFGAFANTLSIGGVIKLDPAEVDFNDGRHEYLLVRMPSSISELNETVLELKSLQNPGRKDEASRVIYGKFSRGRLALGEGGELAWSLDGEQVVTGQSVGIENLKGAYRLYSQLKNLTEG